MLRLWSWLSRKRASSRPTSASARSLRPRSARVDFDTLEDRLVPSSTTLSHDVWRHQTFAVTDALINNVAPSTVSTTAATGPTNLSFGGLIGLNSVLGSTSYHGSGYSVAVIDTGIDYTHPDLGGGWGHRVLAGWDFVNNDADPMDDNGHGTHVAGIIGSSSLTYSGVAPDVNFVALKVLDKNGSGSFGAVEDALNWVIANRTKYNIAAINLSLGSGNYTVNPYDFLEADFAALKSQGVFIAVAAGNNFYGINSTQGLDFPAVSPNVVSVGAVWDGNYGAVGWASGARDNTTAPDRIASFSQRGPALSIMAPGAMINSTYLGGKYQQMAGTSMASPVVAGASILLHQALDATGRGSLANQTYILSVMQATGVRVIDGDDEDDNVVNTNLAYKRLDLAAAMTAIGSGTVTTPNRAPVLASIPDQTVAPGASLTQTLSASDPDGNSLAFSVRVVGGTSSGSQASRLTQSLGLRYLGSYFANSIGMNEKWLGGSGANFYLLLPNGDLRRWTGTTANLTASQNLIANLGAGVYANPDLLLKAQNVNPLTATVVGNQLTLTAASGASGNVQVEVTVSDGKLTATKTYNVTIGAAAANRPPVWTTAPADQRIASGKGKLVVSLGATDPDGQTVSYTVNVTGGAQASISGNQLTIVWPAGFVGKFTVNLTASDGTASTPTSFQVEAYNTPPTLTVPGTITATKGSLTAKVPFAAADVDGDAVTVTARIVGGTGGVASPAYQLKQTYGLSFAGSYFLNQMGMNEKWLISADGKQWYFLLPNGELRKYASTKAAMMSAANLVAKVDVACYTDPKLLWNAAAPGGPNATVTVSNGQVLVMLQSAYQGTITIELTVSDGIATVKKTVQVVFG